jgi:hypothetical protein
MAKQKLARLVRLTTNNQVAIPGCLVRCLKSGKGAYLELPENGRRIGMTPKRRIDDEDFAMYLAVIKRGRAQFEKGETVDWEKVKKKLDGQNGQ